ncbi:hypothetical protein Athai_48910 [Actinocatenispora thailandica]|uniref:DoxX family protein n=1 Tax=Actinocatenispora thailandica TaxID=227318 RepID=A0A7R7HZU2_9ACTN|nr:DoxX family protein [Actinocatenispora thailandica]BCJ37388.1 hypothetical protein Athai_48910 [Actinocatenispora thailandica]
MDRTTAPRAEVPRTGNRMLWVLQAVTALGFAGAAVQKLTASEQVMATFQAIGLGSWFRYLLAGLELLGAAALFVPRLAGLAGLAFTGLAVGAVAAQLGTGGSPVPALVLLVTSAVIAWGRRSGTRRLWRALRRPRRPDASR